MKANTETLKQKLQIISENKEYLEKQEFDPANAGFGDLQAVKHCMFEIAEASIDIASHIIASEGFRQPDDYSGVFLVLAENGIIEENLAENLADMARFRNFLVHRYGEIEDSRLEEFLSNDLDDIEELSRAVYEYMDE
jgi:uncharacterized protein YutE (UPF0331/DUF86 family)